MMGRARFRSGMPIDSRRSTDFKRSEEKQVGKVWLGMRKRVEHLRRLAVVFAVPIRIKIVTELYQRDMSPTLFYEEFGGGSVSRVAQHFEKLEETKWLREVESKGPGGKRRGGTERFYRSTELAFCDHPTWVALPYSIRLVTSWNGFKEIAAQVRRAMEELTFQALPGRQLTNERLLLDEEGWTRVSDAVAEEFEGQWEEQDDARRRVAHSGEKLFRVGSLLVAFELPSDDEQRFGPSLVASQEPMISLPVRLSKVFEDEICIQIIDEANRGDISVPVFEEKYGKAVWSDQGCDPPPLQQIGAHRLDQGSRWQDRGETTRRY